MKAVSLLGNGVSRGSEAAVSPVEKGAVRIKLAPGRQAESGAKLPGERMYRVEHREAEAYVEAPSKREDHCWRAFRAAILTACEGPDGKSRAVVANLLGYSEKTLEHWMNESSPERAPKLDVLFALLTRRDILPDTSRRVLAQRFVEACGMVVVTIPDSDLEQVPAATQMLEILAAHGRAAERLRASLERSSEAGNELSVQEAAALLMQAREMLRETAELVHGLGVRAGEK